MAAIAVFGSRTEAEIAKAHLESEGIAARLVTDSAGGMEPQLDAIRGVKLIVADEHVELATEILDVPEYQPDQRVPREYPRWVVRWAVGAMTLLVAAGLFLTVLQLL